MATVPLGQFDQPGSPAQPIGFDPGSAPDVSSGRLAIADSLRQAGQHEFDQSLQIQRDTASAKAAATLTSYGTQARSDALEIATQLQDGALDPTKAADAYKNLRDSRDKPDAITGLDKVTQIHLQSGMQNADLESSLTVQRIANKATRDQGKAAALSTFDNIVQGASLPGGDLDKSSAQIDSATQLARSQGVPDYQVTKLAQSAKQEMYGNDVKGRMIAADNNVDQLSQLKAELADPKSKYATNLDPDHRLAFQSGIENKITVLENKAEHAKDRADATAQRAINQMDQQDASTVPPTTDQMMAWASVTKGTSFEQEFKDRLADQQTVQDVLKKAPADQQTWLQQKQAAMDANGGSLRDQRNLARVTQAVTKNITTMQNNPVLWAQNRNGVNTTTLDLTQANTPQGAQDIGAELGRRLDTVTTLQKTNGPSVKTNLLLPQEAAQLSSTLAGQSPAQQVQTFAALNRVAPTPAAYTAIMGQFRANNPIAARAGELYAKQQTMNVSGTNLPSETLASPDIAVTMLKGAQALAPVKEGDGKPSSFPMPPVNHFRDAFNASIGDAYGGNAALQEEKFQEVRAYYAGRTLEQGTQSEEHVDPKVMQEAVIATQGAPIPMNGHTVMAPWGMSTQAFRDVAQQRLQQAWGFLKDPQVHDDAVAKSSLVQALDDKTQRPIDGLYHVMLGGQLKTDPQGHYLGVYINQPTIITP